MTNKPLKLKMTNIVLAVVSRNPLAVVSRNPLGVAWDPKDSTGGGIPP